MSEETKSPFEGPEFIEAVNKIVGGHLTKRFESFEGRQDKKFEQILTKLSPQSTQEETPEDRLTLKSLQDRIKRTEQERDQERASNRDKTLRSHLAEKLTNAGLTPAQQKPIISMFVNEKIASLSDTGEVQFQSQYKGEYVSADEGIASWLQSEGKDFLPQKQGAGMRPLRSNQQQKPAQVSANEMDTAIYDALLKQRQRGI